LKGIQERGQRPKTKPKNKKAKPPKNQKQRKRPEEKQKF
jgi:hypothetical protein